MTMRRLIDLITEALSAEQQDEIHKSAMEETGFWGEEGAGCIIMAKSSGRILLGLRSKDVQEPHTWGGWGGAIDQGLTAEQAVRKEVSQETEYRGNLDLHPLYVFNAPGGDFRYSNYLALIDEEFTPRLDWETDEAEWFEFGDWPKPLHFGLKALFNDTKSMQTIQQHLDDAGD